MSGATIVAGGRDNIPHLTKVRLEGSTRVQKSMSFNAEFIL